uniref:Uncharacterized protein n=1 Tax=viral metagenome TaxID=1070528 RepID=A0A6M3LHT7_9ZZZZ
MTALNWEGTLKPNIGNFLFAKSQWAGNPSKKEKYLGKASDYCPKETLFATHRYFGYLDTFDDEADQCADVMKYFYDGMTPAWTMFFNAAVAKIKKKNYGDAVRLLNHSLYHLPYYQPAIDILRKIYSMAPFPRRGVNMKRVKETTLRGIDFFEADIKVQESMIQANRERIVSLILSEKVEMNIPPNWLYDFRGKVFTPPTQVPEGGQIVEIGVAKLPAIIYPNNP